MEDVFAGLTPLRANTFDVVMELAAKGELQPEDKEEGQSKKPATGCGTSSYWR